MRNLVTVAALLGGLLGFGFMLLPGDRLFGALSAPSESDSPLGLWALGYAVTVVGVILGAGFRRVLRLQSQGRAQIRPLALLSDVFRSPDLWLGLLGSPLLFALFVKTLADVDAPSLIAIALQNGFFCSTLVTELVVKPPK